MSQPQAASVAAPVANEPQAPVVSHQTILEIEAKARETYKISVNLCKITSVLNLKDFGKPIEVVTRINEFALRSSDIAVCGESCVSENDNVHEIFKLTHQQRFDDVFFRAVALMEAETVEGVDQRVRAANAVRRARIETRAEYEVRKAVMVAEKEKSDMKTYIKMGSLKSTHLVPTQLLKPTSRKSAAKGRWGHRLFEGDSNCGTVYEKFLNAGLWDWLFKRLLSKTGDGVTPELHVFLLGMLMMRAGSTIENDNMEYMRTVFPTIPSQSGYAVPIFDLGFRDPGKAQAVAALEHYKNGVPLDIRDSGCFTCCKIQSDLDGGTLRRCSRCKEAEDSNKTCQRNYCAKHKGRCHKEGIPPNNGRSFTFLNV